MLMVKVKPLNVVGLLLETHLLPVSSPVATPGAQKGGLAAFGIVVVGDKFLIASLGDLEPLLEPPTEGEPTSPEPQTEPSPGLELPEGGPPPNAEEDEQRSTKPQTGRKRELTLPAKPRPKEDSNK